LLAGPGTGKTTRVKEIIDSQFPDVARILILSFTNATVQDLKASFEDYAAVDCFTLHSYALKINPLKDHYVLESSREESALTKLADDIKVDFGFLCSLLQCITFDAMIAECLKFLQTNQAYGAEQIGELDLLIVDEYQDFNAIERELVNAISEFSNETIVLGDDDQSIYGFKDADPDGIIALFEREGVERLEHDNKCYRCPDAVVDRATKLIKQNKRRIIKPWDKTHKQGDFVQRQFLSQSETSEFIVSEIQRIRHEEPASSFLVLTPVRYYVDELVEILTDRQIEFVNFWASSISEDDYFRVWWLRVIFSERQLLNLLFLSKQLTQHFQRKLKGILRDAVQKDFDRAEVIKKIEGFYNTELIARMNNRPTLASFLEEHPEFYKVIERLDENNLAQSLDDLLKSINPSKRFLKGAVNVMSIHKSKGLQAETVFVSGLVDGVLPNNTKGIDTIEAQRRLLFVGMTRAFRSLYLLSSVEWDGKYVQRLDKAQFQYVWRKKKWNARTSKFVGEMM
jgi:DNA helicase II / ATP-dependent DNA helicase PcrA